MPTIPEELDVFYVPHHHMKQLVYDVEDQISQTNFRDADAFLQLLGNLSQRFHQFKVHEEIENKYILRPLLPRLPTNTNSTLENDIHSDNRLSDLVSLVERALHSSFCQCVSERECFEKELKHSIANFTIDFIPHMNEEEEVFLPLLLRYYSESELRQLTQTVIELHNLSTDSYKDHPPSSSEPLSTACVLRSDGHKRTSLTDLPPEVLLKIFSHLGPQDLCRLVQVHPAFSSLPFDGSLWQHLHPVRWAAGHWKFFTPPYLSSASSSLLTVSLEMEEENNDLKKLLACGDAINARLDSMTTGSFFGECDGCNTVWQSEETLQRESLEEKMLVGILDHLLPKIGRHVETLDLSYSCGATTEMVHHILRHCPKLKYLDLSHIPGLTDYAFRGLLDPGGQGTGRPLQYLNLVGCSMITDTSLLRIAWACSPPPPPMPTTCLSCSCGRRDVVIQDSGDTEGGPQGKGPALACLVLSECHLITDVGLKSLAVGGGLPMLEYLDLSGISGISSSSLNELVAACPRLKPELLSYCDNIQNGPHPTQANGCQCPKNAFCCRYSYLV